LSSPLPLISCYLFLYDVMNNYGLSLIKLIYSLLSLVISLEIA